MKTESDTPRTDATSQYCYGHVDRKWVSVTFARTLERELNAAQARIAELEAELESHAWEISPAMAQAKIDELNAKIERLEAQQSPAPQFLAKGTAQRYRKKPVEIEAMQFTPESKYAVYNWITCTKEADWSDEKAEPVIKIQTLEGDMVAHVGDWIIKGVKGEFYPCKPEIFEMTYETLENTHTNNS